ncbi:replication endonuclease [Vibrio sp. AK197]
MTPRAESTEIELFDFPWQAPLTPVEAGCLASRFSSYQPEPEDLSVIERQMFEVNPRDHEWRKKFFQDVPMYLAKYFAKRYIELCKKAGAKVANTFLRQKMAPATERVGLVMQKYKALPTTRKVALLSKEHGEGENSFHPVFFTEYGHPEDIERKQASFDFEQAEKHHKTVRNRILAELEQDELREMAFKIAEIVNARFQVISGKISKLDVEAINKTLPISEHYIPEVDGYEQLAQFVEEFGIKAPRKYKKQNALSALNDISRMLSDKWWLDRLVKSRKIMREHLAIAMGQVSSKASPYASWDCVREHQDQQKRNWDYIKQRELFDEETGEQADLAEMVLKSVSNPAIRRHELMVRCRGCEDIGNELGLQGLFLTLTTPSKYHNSYKKGGFIDHWNGASPRDAQLYLNKVWQRIRAKLGRDGIRWFGVRVAEPHHDGTPHWHLLIWVKPEEVIRVRDTFISYATLEDRHELHPELEKEKKKPFRKGAYVGPMDYRPRCDFGLIDPEKGTATGYIAKYISKNIDGFAMDDDVSDETGKSVKDMAKNVSAWKSRWRIRQFQFFGGAPVTTYRELRRFANHNKKAFMDYLFMQERVDLLTMYSMLQRELVGPIKPSRLISNRELMEVIGNCYQARIKAGDASVTDTLKAADEGNWQGYIMGQGGPFVKRDDLLIVNSYEVLPFASPHGEEVRKIEGFKTPETTIRTRLRVWTIQKKSELSDEAEACNQGSEATAIGGFAASRSSVNNCTEPCEGQVCDQLNRLLSPNQKLGKSPPVYDEPAISALLKGSSLKIDEEKSIQIRPVEVDEYGNRRPAQLVEVRRDVSDSQNWTHFEGWDKALENVERSEYRQPNLSIFPELDTDWPMTE